MWFFLSYSVRTLWKSSPTLSIVFALLTLLLCMPLLPGMTFRVAWLLTFLALAAWILLLGFWVAPAWFNKLDDRTG